MLFSGKDLSARSCCASLDVNDVTAYAAHHDEHHQGSDRLSRASGATAISIIETEGVCSFRVGLKIDQNAVSVSCLPETVAAAVVKSARQHGGKTPNVDVALASLHQAASDHRATLTPHTVAVERPGDAVKRLDAYIGSSAGPVRWCSSTRNTTEATEGGCCFMTDKVALARLRLALVPF